MKTKPIQSLRLENVSYAFADGRTSVFQNISVDLPKARAVWIRSPGQRGKSTLLKILAGLLTPTAGRYLINGEAVSEMSFEKFLPYRLSLGYGFEMGGLLNNKTLYENLMLPLLYHDLVPHDEALERVEEMLGHFGIGEARDQRPYAVSGSQRKLTCVLRPFVTWPQIVFLDDPMTGLKQDNLNDLVLYIEESFGVRGLKQVFFTGENATIAKALRAEELLISVDGFTTARAA